MKRERLTITLDDAVLSAVDATIDGSSIRNRSHALEHLVREGLLLHQLRQIVLVVTEPENETFALRLAKLCQESSIERLFCVSTDAEQAANLKMSLFTLAPETQVTIVSGEFGDAAALTLIYDKLPHSFVTITTSATLPDSLLPLYSYHVASGKHVTQQVHATGNECVPTGVTVIRPEVIARIPAGRTTLSELFSVLAKEGTVGIHVA